MAESDRARRAAEAVIDDLEGRGGFDGWWGGIDRDIQQEILETLAEVIAQAYE